MSTTPPNEDRPMIAVVHGPNLNMLGTREPDVYGSMPLAEIDRQLSELGKSLGFVVESFQSNSEGALVDYIQSQAGKCSGLIINPAALTHTSVAIRDALLLLDVPKIEIHLSNIYKREEFRHKSLTAAAVTAQISGLGPEGYLLALNAMARMI